MGGGKAGWDVTEWVPLCRRCHDILDDRAGVSRQFEKDKTYITLLIENGLKRGEWP